MLFSLTDERSQVRNTVNLYRFTYIKRGGVVGAIRANSISINYTMVMFSAIGMCLKQCNTLVYVHAYEIHFKMGFATRHAIYSSRIIVFILVVGFN